jgi:uncharacterized coiled-coil protein SlyX
MNITLQELQQMLGERDIVIHQQAKQIAELTQALAKQQAQAKAIPPIATLAEQDTQ